MKTPDFRVSIHHFFSSLKKVGPWQEQIDAVISGEVDGTMVLESVWRANSHNRKKTKIIAEERNLPSPLIVYGKNVDADLLSEFKKMIFSYKPQNQSDALFNGFVPFQKELTENFCRAATKALG